MASERPRPFLLLVMLTKGAGSERGLPLLSLFTSQNGPYLQARPRHPQSTTEAPSKHDQGTLKAQPRYPAATIMPIRHLRKARKQSQILTPQRKPRPKRHLPARPAAPLETKRPPHLKYHSHKSSEVSANKEFKAVENLFVVFCGILAHNCREIRTFTAAYIIKV